MVVAPLYPSGGTLDLLKGINPLEVKNGIILIEVIYLGVADGNTLLSALSLKNLNGVLHLELVGL